jgi:hypothetical protein
MGLNILLHRKPRLRQQNAIFMKKSVILYSMERDKKMTDARGEAITKELEVRPGLDRKTLCKSYGVTLRTYQRWLADQKAKENK